MTDDFWAQFEVENTPQNNSNEDYWQQFEEVPQQNEQALENVNELPADDSYVAEKKYTEDQLARVLFTPEELRAIDSQGPMGWVEYRTRFVTPKDYVPFGMLKQGADASRLLIIAKNIENGKDVSDSDKTYMREQLRKQVELSRRGLNWGATAVSWFVQAPSFMVEFALMGGLGKAAAAGAIKAAGAAATKAAIKAGTKIASSKLGAMALGRKATEKVGTRYALSVSAEIVGKGAAYQGALVPMYAYENYGERQIADGLKITDKGEVMFSAPKENVTNLLKAFGTGEITILSELTGGIIGGSVKGIAGKVAATNVGRGISAVSAKIYNSLPKATRVKLEAVNKVMKGYGEKLKDKNVEFHGIAEEMGEERLEDILSVAFDLDDNEGYSFDQFGKAIFPGWQQLLLEAGIFSIMGSASLATRTVITDLKNKGYSEEEAKQIANNLSEIEKEHMANEIIGEVKMNEDITEDEVNKEAEAIQLKLFDYEKLNADAANNTEMFDVRPVNFDGNKVKDKNNPLDYDYINFGDTNEKIKLEINPELEKRGNEKVKPIEIIKTDIQFKSGKKSDVQNAIKQKLFEYQNGKPIPIQATNRNTNVSAIINASTIDESAKELLSDVDRDFVANLLLNSRNIFETSEYLFSNDDAKNTNLKNKQKIQRYGNIVNYNNENYVVVTTLKDKSNNNQKNQPEIKIYHISGYKNSDIKMRNHNTSNLDIANISIHDLADFVKSRVVEKYNNDYKAAQKERSDNEFYDAENISKKSQKLSTKQSKTDENETETAADKIIKGESWFGKFYTDWVNRLTPIEALEQKAKEKKDLNVTDSPNILARLYSGLVGAVRAQIEKNTYVITPAGNIKVTGEGFLPILNDFDNDFKSTEPNQDKRHRDLKKYLEAQRFLLDLQDRENFEATEEQKLEAVKTIADLTAKYGDRLQDFDKYANRIYDYQKRILHNLVDSGNMSQETYDKIIKDNPHYIPFQRVMDEEFSSSVSSRSKFSGAKSKIKSIKGSGRDIKDPFESILKNTYQILDTSSRNRVAKAIASLSDVLPEYITVRKPVYEIGHTNVKVAYDAKMRAKLEEAIKYFGGNVKYQKAVKGGNGLILGSYNPSEKIVRKRLGSQDRTLAHEFGHMLDFVLDIESKLTPEVKKEISKLAEERFKTIVTFANGKFTQEFDNEANSASYVNYIKSTKEAIANMFDLYFTSRDYMKKAAPKSYKFIEDLFKGDYKFLKDIRPSAETGIEEIEQEVWIPSKLKPGGNVIEYWEDGKRKFVEVTKPVMEAINDLTMPELGFVQKMLTASSTVLRTGATIMPDFWIRNIIRDQPIAFIQTNKTRPFIDMVKGLTSLIKKDEVYREWLASGGSFNSYMDLSDKSMREAMKELTGTKSKLSKYLKSGGLKAIEDVSMAFEQATRIGIYARERLNSPALIAALEAREGTLDFGRSGSKGRYVNRYIPFFNAAIQGVDKMVRTFQQHPVIASVKCLSAITLPSLILTGYYLYAAPDDDKQEYLEIPQWQKDLFWCFKVGDNWWRIPKPFEIGYIFGSIPERFMTWAYREELPEGKEIFETVKGLFNATSPITDVGGFMPPILRVSVENITNYNFFTGKNLYPKYLDELEPAERKNRYTSQTAQLIGQKLNISPAKIENAISGSIGSSSKYVLDAGDFVINSVKKYNGEEINEKPSSLNDVPVLRSFVVREPQGYQTQSINDFFDTYKNLETKSKTYKKKNGTEKKEYYDKNKQDIKAFKKIKRYYDRIKETNKRIQKIYDNSNLTGEEKTERISPLAKKISEEAFEANAWYKEYKGDEQ